ncbi:putative lipoprotein [Alteromonas sp. KUL156]|nr:putative lipoprotein [Alteromonas sp. KUL154]GFE01955.1 putative lipoprotein [Alteromonas sp. KUL156]
MCPDVFVVTIMTMLKTILGASILLSLFISAGCSDNKATDVGNESNAQLSTPSHDADALVVLATQQSIDGTPTYPYQEGDAIPALAYIAHNEVYNPESVIPPQCYTKTDGVNNPCYACHQSYDGIEKRPNQMGDGTLQGNYEFSDVGLTNSWKNLFIDRTSLIASIDDATIRKYVAQDNYTASLENNAMPEYMRIENLAAADKAFDSKGFAHDGSGWVSYNYKPFPSTFWPTNGSTGDAMIRLPEDFQTLNGEYNKAIYTLNLSLVEMALKALETLTVAPVDEVALKLDVNQDGKLSSSVTEIARSSHYVGDARAVPLAHMLYPEGTEFLHTVRYIGVDDRGNIYNAPRMKEVRYMKKHMFRSRESLASAYYAEAKDKHFEKLPQTRYLGEKGIDNGFGWTINGFIENEKGELRAQHDQELAFCNGCHKTVGSTFDQTFSFARKVPGEAGWGYINLREIEDVPNINEEKGEFLTYMERVGGGDEFRQNGEMLAKWFDEKGMVKAENVQRAKSVYEIITPSPERANALNKAYLTIVKEQSYLFGRDATLTEATNVLSTIDAEQPPLKPEHRFKWDMRLDWQKDKSSAIADAR